MEEVRCSSLVSDHARSVVEIHWKQKLYIRASNPSEEDILQGLRCPRHSCRSSFAIPDPVESRRARPACGNSPDQPRNVSKHMIVGAPVTTI